MEAQLTAPNGKSWAQPVGLFINNEFVKSSNDQKLASINPTYVEPRAKLICSTCGTPDKKRVLTNSFSQH